MKVADPCRWLEETSSPAVVSWMKAQNDFTRSVFQRIPGRDKLLERIKALDNAAASYMPFKRGAVGISTSKPTRDRTTAKVLSDSIDRAEFAQPT